MAVHTGSKRSLTDRRTAIEYMRVRAQALTGRREGDILK
jgi:hypothetical protein